MNIEEEERRQEESTVGERKGDRERRDGKHEGNKTNGGTHDKLNGSGLGEE